MPFHSALSTAHDLETACRDVAANVRSALGSERADLLVAFASPLLGELDELPERLLDELPARHLVGGSGGGVVAADREIEDRPALAVLAARVPRVGLHPRLLSADDLPNPDAPPSAWCEQLGLQPKDARGFVVLPDPYSFPVTRLLDGLDYAYPDCLKVGGLVSGGSGPGGNVMFVDQRPARSGAVVLGLSGRLSMTAVVAQGCKPIGAAGTVTRCDGHELIAVDGKPALRFLEDQLQALDEADLALARRAPMFVGLAMDPFAVEAPEAGEFLIRQILGIDRREGSLAIGGAPRVGRKVRFHLRDRATSAEDLERTLARIDKGHVPSAALLFSCLGRGQHLYGEPGHDSETFRQQVGSVALTGFFCNGEIGPVGGTTHLHGYTSVFALLREAPE